MMSYFFEFKDVIAYLSISTISGESKLAAGQSDCHNSKANGHSASADNLCLILPEHFYPRVALTVILNLLADQARHDFPRILRLSLATKRVGGVL